MDKFYFGMSVDDVALRGWCKVENFRHLIEFFRAEQVPATFFVVPVDEESDKPFYTLSADYLPIIKEAAQSGFDFEQHGLRHNRFELGVPPAMVLDLPHEAENKRWAAANRDFLAKDHCVENCRARLRRGRTVLEDAFGFAVTGFRSPALQESPGMFAALKAEGYAFDSSGAMQPTGWDYIQGRMDTPPRAVGRAAWDALRAKSSGLMLPLTCDYTWYLTHEKYSQTMQLAEHDLDACLAAGIPFVTVCHVDPVHEGEGLRFLHELYELARARAAAAGRETVFANLKDIAGVFNR